jgi:hypothetical protein
MLRHSHARTFCRFYLASNKICIALRMILIIAMSPTRFLFGPLSNTALHAPHRQVFDSL